MTAIAMETSFQLRRWRNRTTRSQNSKRTQT